MLGPSSRRLEEIRPPTTGALVIVTADHGVSFRREVRGVTRLSLNMADIAAVPLFVKYPGQTRGRTDRRAASVIDVLPTIADVLEIRRAVDRWTGARCRRRQSGAR